jgi:uncharacterized repeat protein (TIGR03803 family)
MTWTTPNFVAICAIAAVAAPATPGATYSVVAYMTGGPYHEPGTITEGSPGVFYSEAGGQTAFSVTAQGKLTTLATFGDPPTIDSYVLAAPNSLFYSSALSNGHSNVFSVGSQPGKEQTYPAQALFAGLVGNLPSGSLFGAACPAGSNGACSLATVDTNGGVTPFYQFPATDYPYPPIYGPDRNYYGTAYTYGVAGTYLYKATASGSLTKIATMPFGTSGFVGVGLILQGSDGNFYGVQSTGVGCSASNQHGAVYKLTPSGQFSILHDFGVCGNGVVNTLIQASDGKLYGATQGNSLLFSLTTSGEYKALFKTTNGSTEGLCPCWLLQGSDGKLYGIAQGGGPTGDGVVFALDAGLPAPKPQALEFSPASGAAGTKVRIWGRKLLQASAQFNGAAAAGVYNSGPNYVWATVPEGATTGPITVTTPGGTSTTAASFTVQ